MNKSRKGKSTKAISYEQAVGSLPQEQSKREVLLAKFRRAHSDYHAALDRLGSSFKALSSANAELVENQALLDSLRMLVDLGPDAPAPEPKVVDAPLMTDAEFRHQREINPDIENVGKSNAFFSMDEFIGGFSRFPNREEHHEQAAARYLSLYERAQIGGARATDYSMPMVDRSGPLADTTMAVGEDARREFFSLRDALTSEKMSLLELVIVGRTAARQIAAKRLGKENVTGRAVAQVAQEVKEALEAAAAHFGFRSRRRPGEVYLDRRAREAITKAKRHGRRNGRNRLPV